MLSMLSSNNEQAVLASDSEPLLPRDEESSRNDPAAQDERIAAAALPETIDIEDTTTTAPSSPSSDRPRYTSLARSSTTPILSALVISVLTLFTHTLFLYAQTAPMWRLHLAQNISVWANATGKETKWAFDTLNIPHENHFFVLSDRDVQDFTYMYSVKELWRAQGWTGKTVARITAVLLILCSGVWPHLKLFLLHLTWLFPMRSAIRRQRFLHWLSTLGKWSLADVLTVCVMIGVLHLEWKVDPAAIKQGVLREMPLVTKLVHGMYSATSLCTKLLHYDCTSPHKFDHIAKCQSCRKFVNEAFDHPSWAKTTGKMIMEGVHTSGGGEAELSVVGMRGIYVFCGAVILSILLSLIVDVYDVRATRAQRRLERANCNVVDTVRSTPDTTTNDLLLLNGQENGDAIENNDDILSQRAPPVSFVLRREEDTLWLALIRHVVPFAVLVMVILGAFLPTMIRKADGAIPLILKDILGLDWTRPYSLNTLMETTGLAGGWDNLLMATFGLFLLAGPIARAILGVFALAKFVPERLRPPLATAIDFIGAFCAWEIIAVAIIMTGLLMPNITNTIISNPECIIASPDGKCLEVFFDILPTFWLLVAGGALLVGVSAFSVHTGKTIELEYEFILGNEETKDDHVGTLYQRLEGQEQHVHSSQMLLES